MAPSCSSPVDYGSPASRRAHIVFDRSTTVGDLELVSFETVVVDRAPLRDDREHVQLLRNPRARAAGSASPCREGHAELQARAAGAARGLARRAQRLQLAVVGRSVMGKPTGSSSGRGSTSPRAPRHRAAALAAGRGARRPIEADDRGRPLHGRRYRCARRPARSATADFADLVWRGHWQDAYHRLAATNGTSRSAGQPARAVRAHACWRSAAGAPCDRSDRRRPDLQARRRGGSRRSRRARRASVAVVGAAAPAAPTTRRSGVRGRGARRACSMRHPRRSSSKA